MEMAVPLTGPNTAGAGWLLVGVGCLGGWITGAQEILFNWKGGWGSRAYDSDNTEQVV